MDKKNIQSILQDALEEEIPSSQIHLWQAIRASFVAGKHQQGDKMNPINVYRQITRTAFVTMALASLLAVAFISPQGRALAQDVIEFFKRADSEERPLPLGQNRDPLFATAQPPIQFTSVTEAEKSIGFDAKELPAVPKGFTFAGVMAGGGGISIQYQAQGNGGQLVINESTDGFMQSDWDQAPEDAITQVRVGNLDAEIVQGAFVVYPGETVAKWNPDAPILRLRWIEDGIWFEMAKFGNVESIQYLDQDGLVKLAGSMK